MTPARAAWEFQAAALAAFERASVGTKAPVSPCANAREFVDKYALTIDGRRFDWFAYPHLVDWYEDPHPMQVAMAGAQTGKSARLMAELARLGSLYYGRLIAYYFPDQLLARAFSRERFKPFMESNAELAEHFGVDKDGASADSVDTRRFGATTMFFLSVKGKTTTEGLPLSAAMFDEVRRMEPGDVQRAEERYSAQLEYSDWKVSTAYLPDSDIHAYFKRGDQRYFHTACGCADGVVLSLTFPDNVVDLTRASPEFRRKVAHKFSHAGLPWLGMNDRQLKEYGEAVYVCPRCGEVLVNPRDGWWEPHNPGAYTHSWQHPQLLSPTYPAARCWKKWNRQTTEPVDIREVNNSMLGLPWVDPTSTPINDDVLRAAIVPTMPWASKLTDRQREDDIRASAMGVDVQAGYLVVLIVTSTRSGQIRLAHLEILHPGNSRNEDPWEELSYVMFRFKVRAAVIDAQPEFSSAQRFALRHQGRVWLCYYNENEKGLTVDWKDRKKPPAGDKGTVDLREKYRVVAQRSKLLQWALGLWKEHRVETPDVGTLLQELPKQAGRPAFTASLASGTWEPVDMLREVLWWHLSSVIFEKEFPNDTARREGRYVIKALHVGCDPHFAHAFGYACAAFSRIGGRSKPPGLDGGGEE